MMKNNIYSEAYRLLENFTPLKADCGALCDKNCCKGDGGTGMLLFPNEETTLEVIERNGRRLAVCNGECNRSERPLSCRIFPFFPVIDGNSIKVIPDYRGINVCPMVAHNDEIKFSKRFLRRVKRVGELLVADPECAEFIREISEEIEDAKKINDIFCR